METHIKRYSIILTLIFSSMLLLACSDKTEPQKPQITTAKSADGSLIQYGVQGKGDVTLVFVHCWTCNHTFWTPQLEYFANKHKVVWLDLAGHGLSSSQRNTYTMQAFGQDVAAVVNATATDKVILIGHSMGGPVILEAAKQLGERVIGIVGVDTFYTPFPFPQDDAGIRAFVEPFETDFQNTTEQMVRSMFLATADQQLVETTVSVLKSANKQMAVSAMNELFNWSLEQRTVLLERYKDRVRNINAAPTGSEQPLHQSVTLIPKVGHFVPQAKPDEFNQVLSTMILEFNKG